MTIKRYPLEFKRDAVALTRQAGAGLPQIAKDLGIGKSTLHNWVQKADIDAGDRPGLSTADAQKLRDLRRRNKLLEQEAEVMRRAVGYLSREINPKWGIHWSVTLP